MCIIHVGSRHETLSNDDTTREIFFSIYLVINTTYEAQLSRNASKL